MEPTTAEARRGRPGTLLVLGILALAVGLAAFAVWFQWSQTRRCLAFFGPQVAAAIQTAPRVEAWRLAPGGTPAAVRGSAPADVSQSRGLVHLRHGLVEDSNYDWSAAVAGRPIAAWDVALAFFDSGAARPRAVLAFDLDDAGAMTVVGQRGSVGLGRLGPGLRRWITTTLAAPVAEP